MDEKGREGGGRERKRGERDGEGRERGRGEREREREPRERGIIGEQGALQTTAFSSRRLIKSDGSDVDEFLFPVSLLAFPASPCRKAFL